MLVLTRKTGEKVVIGDDITVTVVAVTGNRVRVSIDAPDQVPILRAELLGCPDERSYPSRQLSLLLLAGTFAVCRLDSASSIPPWAIADELFSITRTADELSIICRQDAVPEGILCERGWRCLRVAGTIPFSVVGVLASLTAPLAEAGISVFAISTFDTDYLLVKAADLGRSVDILRGRGHTIQ
jgi:carbon storage regulator CsrA